MPSDPPAMPGPLAGRVALVTGAAHRLGRALALALAQSGADVLVHAHTSLTEAESAAREIEALGRRARVVRADLRDSANVRQAFGTGIDEMGRLDVLVNNVGTIAWKRLEDHEASDWRDCLDGTLFATLNASEAALPALRSAGHGRIINILDVDADSTGPVPFATAYKIGKRATLTLTRTMAVTEAPHGVTVNAIGPGTLEDSPTRPDLTRIPSGRFGTYDDVAGAVIHLASDAAAYTTGALLPIAGGYLL